MSPVKATGVHVLSPAQGDLLRFDQNVHLDPGMNHLDWSKKESTKEIHSYTGYGNISH